MSPGAWSAEDTRVAPAVFEPEHFDDSIDEDDAGADAEPGSVLVPTGQLHALGEDARVQLRHTDSGELALPIYTSVESLVACCGEEQAWLAVTLETLPGMVSEAGAEGLVVDMPLPEQGGEERGGH